MAQNDPVMDKPASLAQCPAYGSQRVLLAHFDPIVALQRFESMVSEMDSKVPRC